MTTAIQTATAVGYFRVSTPGQAGERHVSLEVQAAAFNDYCRVHHLDPIASFTDIASGRKDDRAQYKAMLAHVKEHSVGNVVVLFLDRFGRNPREILRRYWELQERGVTVQSVNEDLREELLLLVRAGIAGQESKRTSERVRMALREAAKRGTHVGAIPFGYIKVRDRDGDGKHIEQVPEQVAIIRLAYELATVDNLGYKAIANYLNKRGHRARSGKSFMAETVKVILLNPALVGRMVFKGGLAPGAPIVVEKAYPAILSDDEWDMLQLRLTIRRDGRHRGRVDVSQFLLSGIAKCGYCGGPMGGSASGKRHKYYVCTRNKSAEDRCGERNPHRKDALEDAILEHLGQYTDSETVRELLQAQGEETDIRAEAELASVTARLGELETGFLNDLDRVDRGVMTEPEYLKRQGVRRLEQEGLTRRQAELEAEVAAQRGMESQVCAVPVKVRSFLEDFRGMPVPQAKAVLQGILKAVHVWKDGRLELEFR
jgi:site-specific DNA recombinase